MIRYNRKIRWNIVLLVVVLGIAFYQYRNSSFASQAKEFSETVVRAALASNCDTAALRKDLYPRYSETGSKDASIDDFSRGCQLAGNLQTFSVSKVRVESYFMSDFSALATVAADATFDGVRFSLAIGLVRHDGRWWIWGIKLDRGAAAFGIYDPAK